MRWLDSEHLLVNDREPNKEKWMVLRQVGWLGGSGAFYTMEDSPLDDPPGHRREPKSLTPMYAETENF